MVCPTCHNDKAGSLLWKCFPNDPEVYKGCDRCMSGAYAGAFFPDVFTGKGGGVKTDENLAWRSTGNPAIDAKFEGKPIPWSSKRDKALAMKLAGVRQADSAERQHGHRNEEHLNYSRRRHFKF